MISLRHITGLEEKPCLVWWGRNTEFREGVVRAGRGMGTGHVRVTGECHQGHRAINVRVTAESWSQKAL